jgi:hypothetical protein
MFQSSYISLCEQQDGNLEKWSGMGANLVLESQDGDVHVNGFLRTDSGVLDVNTTLRFGMGPQWDELRKHPALFALAVAVAAIPDQPRVTVDTRRPYTGSLNYVPQGPY